MAILSLCDCEWPGQVRQFKYPALGIAHPRIHYEVHRVAINDAQLVSQCRAWCMCVCTGGPPFVTVQIQFYMSKKLGAH